jgi:glucose/arabinose dehydrogenase
VIVNIPRSAKDHLNNQISFDPAAKNLYFVVPSMSAMGAPDGVWDYRPEEIATAAMFRLQLRQKGTRLGVEEYLAANGPINLDPASRKPYNLYKGTNPLRLYATGIRNAYDMVWHSNGHLYLPSNGSAAGGNVPGTPKNLANVPNPFRLDYDGTNPYLGPAVVAQENIDQTVEDFLFDVKQGGYYGHPNPLRGEYVLNGGDDPKSGLARIFDYPGNGVIKADRNYGGYAFSFGKNVSPNGVIEYKSNAFGGTLKGSLLVARYNSGSDVIAVKPNADGTFDQNTAATAGLAGLKSLERPLDVVEDPRNGNVYIASLTSRTSGAGKIILSRPLAGRLTPNKPKISLYATPGDASGATQTVTFTNTTNATVFVDPTLIRLTGRDRKSFLVTDFPTKTLRLRAGQSTSFTIKYVARAGEKTIRAGNLAIPLGDVHGSYAAVQLRGSPLMST